MRTKKTVLVGLILAPAAACLVTPSFAADRGGQVLPATAQPYGYSLDTMASDAYVLIK